MTAKRFILILVAIFIIAIIACASAPSTISTPTSTITPSTPAQKEPERTPNTIYPTPVYWEEPTTFSENPADVIFWRKSFSSPPKIKFDGQECRAVASFPEGLSASFNPESQEFLATIYEHEDGLSPALIFDPTYDLKNGGDVWQCTNVRIMSNYITLSGLEVRGVVGFQYSGNPVSPDPLCTIDALMEKDQLLRFVGSKVKVLDYGQTWIGLWIESENAYGCFHLPPSSRGNQEGIQFQGWSVDPVKGISFQHSGWFNKWSQPIGKTGVLVNKGDELIPDYWIIGETIIGENNSEVLKAWPTFLSKLSPILKEGETVDLKMKYLEDLIDPWDMCQYMIEFSYLIPNDVPQCSGTIYDRWHYWVEINDRWFRAIIPTEEEKLQAVPIPWQRDVMSEAPFGLRMQFCFPDPSYPLTQVQIFDKPYQFPSIHPYFEKGGTIFTFQCDYKTNN